MKKLDDTISTNFEVKLVESIERK